MFKLKTDAEARELRRQRNARYRVRLKERLSATPAQGDSLRDTLNSASPSAFALVVCNLVSKREDARAVFDALERSARDKKERLDV